VKSDRKKLALNLVAVVGMAALVGCEGAAPANGGGSSVDSAGSVALVLQGTGSVINTFSYSITGPASYSGTIDVASSTKVSTVIGGIAAGAGYSITLSGISLDGQTTCGGTSALFNIVGHTTTNVTVVIDCHTPRNTGTVLVNGSINVCPKIDSVASNPPVGNVISILSTADDPDGGPNPISYSWTTSSGTLSSATAQNPTLTCSAPGVVSLTLAVTDGDPGCSDSFSLQLPCPADSTLGEIAWVLMGANNQAIARLNTPYSVCPTITVDGVTSPMTVRAPAGAEPLRTTSTDPTLAQAMTSGNSKPSVFTTTTCEFLLPAGAHVATAAGINLPLPKQVVNRVVVLGDTGCRISIGNPYQACPDYSPAGWPYPTIALAAAAMQPDLVLHVGDYQYRDNPCPPGNTACAGEPWGYGSDSWDADVMIPSKPLFLAAPWVAVRGNHEVCNRAGQGWYRYLDTNPFDTTGVKTCNDPANDNVGNFNDPWAVSFGDTEFIAFDSANASKTAYSPPAFQPYTSQLATAGGLASPNLLNIWAVHHPVLGYSAANPPTSGNPGLQSVMRAAYPGNYYPPNIGLAFHGHVHDFQALNFSSNHPATIVAGNGGDNLDAQLPAVFDPNTDLPATGTVVQSFAFSNEFGFMVMDRVGAVGAKNWKFTSYRTDGSIIAVCTMAPPVACSGTCDTTPGSQISCVNAGGSPIGLYQNIP
jgi:hypothetical protein